jgi:hypothetical protein
MAASGRLGDMANNLIISPYSAELNRLLVCTTLPMPWKPSIWAEKVFIGQEMRSLI